MGTKREESGLIRNILLYGVIGCIAAGTDALLFYLLNVHAGISPYIANLISVPTGILISFTLNRYVNFRVMDHPLKRGIIFFSVGLFGLLISQGILWFGVSFSFDPFIVKVVSIVIVAVFQFTLNKLISFGVSFDKQKR